MARALQLGKKDNRGIKDWQRRTEQIIVIVYNNVRTKGHRMKSSDSKFKIKDSFHTLATHDISHPKVYRNPESGLKNSVH